MNIKKTIKFGIINGVPVTFEMSHSRYLSMDEVFITRNQEDEAVYYWLLNDNSLFWKSNNIRIDIGRNKEDVIKRLLTLKHPESVRKKANVTPDLKADMKKDAKLFLTSIFKLSDDELDRLESYLKADSDIESAYFIVQELSLLYRLHDYEDALNYLASWESEVLESGIKEMMDILHTVQNWLPYIMNYFIHRITNGRTEDKNHLLRVIDKMGFHYGMDSIQACIYAHDRKQEYVKWQKHLYKRFKHSASSA